jgi:DNA polymerase-3 subunit alpha
VLVDHEAENVTPREMLQWERELVGVYITEHPLHRLSDRIQRVVSAYSNQLTEADHNRQVTMAGIVTTVRRHTTKSGKAMAFAGLEDLYGQIEVIIWPSTWDETQELWQPDRVLLLRGKIDAERGEPKLLCDAASTNFDVFEPLPGESHGAFAPSAFDETFPEPPPNFDDPSVIDRSSDIGEQHAPPEIMQAVAAAGIPNSEVDTSTAPQVRTNKTQVNASEPSPAQADPDLAALNRSGAAQAGSLHQHVRVQTRRSGDAERDKRSLQRIYGALVSQPGHDSFSITVADGEEVVELEFPNETTSYSPELLAKLGRIVSSEAIEVFPAQA